VKSEKKARDSLQNSKESQDRARVVERVAKPEDLGSVLSCVGARQSEVDASLRFCY